jgi:spermidine synthase
MYRSKEKPKIIKYSRWDINKDYNFKIKNIIKINLSDLKKISINNSNPIICNKTFCVFIKNGDYILTDSRTGLNHSQYNILDYSNKFVYIIMIVNFIKINTLIKNVCILGFGLGGLALELSQIDHIYKIDAVDIDIGMFKIYNSLIENPSNKINYYLHDGLEFIKSINQKYDVIIDDAFDEKKIDYDYSSFYYKLNMNGFLIINIHDITNFNIDILKIYFKNVQVIKAKYNYLVFCQRTS